MNSDFWITDLVVTAGLVCLQPAEKRWKVAGQLLLLSAVLDLVFSVLERFL